MDNAATTKVREEVSDSMISVLKNNYGNPSSSHSYGRSARSIIELSRNEIAKILNVKNSEIIFTSGGTEGNNLALSQYGRVITSSIEHDSVRAVNNKCLIAPVDANGVIKLDSLSDILDKVTVSEKDDIILSVMAANNETGVLQPIEQIAEMALRAGIAFHSDMVQFFGKHKINFASSQISYASISAHKIGGPTGVGALLVQPGCKVKSLLKGGGQERGSRAGTENLVGIAGFSGAVKDAFDDIGHYKKMAKWRDCFEKQILAERSGVEVFGKAAERLGNTSCIAVAGRLAENMVIAFDLAGVAVSAGAACSSGKVKSSHVLDAMGAGERAREAIRISGGWATVKSDFETLADVFLQLYKRSA